VHPLSPLLTYIPAQFIFCTRSVALTVWRAIEHFLL
jgi:hypothetical protein